MRNPKISIITVCYNAVNDIEATINSVINQSYCNLEYLIIDGGSIDGTTDIIKKYSDRISYWVSEPDNGIYDAMNKGILAASGDWVNFMNAGDTFFDNNVLRCVSEELEEDAIIAYGQLMKVYNRFQFVSYTKPILLDDLNKNIRLPHQAMFSKLEYQKKHLFDITYRSAADYKFYYDAYFKHNCQFQYIPIIVANYDAETGMSKDNYIGQIESLTIQGNRLSGNYIKIIKLKYKIINYLKRRLSERIITWGRKRKFSKLGYEILDR